MLRSSRRSRASLSDFTARSGRVKVNSSRKPISRTVQCTAVSTCQSPVRSHELLYGTKPNDGVTLEDDAQVAKDVENVAVAIVSQRYRARPCLDVNKKLKCTELFVFTKSCGSGLISQNAFKIRVSRARKSAGLFKREHDIVNKVGSTSELSDVTGIHGTEGVQTRAQQLRDCICRLF